MFDPPFTVEQFLAVFTRYNESVWPAQLVLLVIAVALAAAQLLRPPRAPRLTWWALALLWLWTGAVYHVSFFTSINGAAYVFGALFLVQAVLLAARGFATVPLERAARPRGSALGVFLVVYALALYPLIGYLLGHRFPANPTFGAPGPVTIFTLGMLLLMRAVPLHLLIIPLVWAAIGGSATAAFGMWEDLAMPVGAVAALFVIGARNRRARHVLAAAPAD